MQSTNEYVTEFGHLHLRIEEILKEKGISKTKVCKELDIPRTNFNRYCQDKQSRWDLKFLCKLCLYLQVDLGELLFTTLNDASFFTLNGGVFA